MSQSNRGAAQVSLMWVIALAVIALVSGLFAFLQSSEATKLQEALTLSQTTLTTEQSTVTAQRLARRELSNVVGFKGDGEFTNDAAVVAARDEMVRVFEIDPQNVRSYSDVQGPSISRVQQITRERDDSLAESARLRNDLAARESAVRSALADKDKALADARREKDELQTSLNSQIVSIERERDAGRDELRTMNTQLSSLRTLSDQQQRDLRNEITKFQQRNSVLSDRLNSVDRRVATADGAVLSSAPDLGMVWIDRGYADRVTAGMEFEVRNANTNAVKGRVKIKRTEASRSEAVVLNQLDKYDPIRTDDLLFNAVYDPNRTPVAVLLGNGFGRYAAADLAALLSEAGIEVREEVSSETDYILLGTPFFDEETGDMMPWESLDEYKSAMALSVEVIPLRDWTQWLGR
ncbi:MAG: hypothetical protein O3A20_02030 [Planctomycetota bacterium]|nr:hypothetical protein [Planctomycetota bacterium]